MLSKAEVQAIIDAAQALKQAKGGKGGAQQAANQNIADQRKAALTKLREEPNAVLFVKNQACNLNNHENNDSKPFYVVSFSFNFDFLKCKLDKYDTEKGIVTATLHESEQAECRVPELKKAGFPAAPENTLEYSKMAERGIDDMVEIDELNPATLLYNLSQKYKKDGIYCYVGPILLAMNPFKFIPALATKELMAQYMEICSSAMPYQLKKQLPPHIYAISALSYRALKDTRQRQAIVISGESGAGKTESAKIAMNFLTDLGKMGGDTGVGDIGTKILACNPVLEGFGNSKTVRNDNSSRFGKYVLMYFALYKDQVFGAYVKNYLLEKSRVIKVAPNERGYHIFYFLLRGAPVEVLKKLHLTNAKGERMKPHDFNYLKTGGDLPEKHDIDGFCGDGDKEPGVLKTMKELKFSDEEIDAVWRCLAAILLLGQIDFDKNSFGGVEENKPGKITNADIVPKIAELLGIKNLKFFQEILLKTRTIVMKEETWKANSLKKCTDNKDALAKQLFNNMFDWLVIKMNLTIQPEELNQPSFFDNAKTIGLLDIFGFENFDSGNNYEQLCINYVNEKLHKLYIAAIFEAECMELTEEGLGHMVAAIQYPDLKVLDVIRILDFKQGSARYAGIKYATPPGVGIFTMVDDKCTSVLQGREIGWKEVADELEKNHGKNTKCYLHDKKNKDGFTIYHSAQNVFYDMKEFVERNVDCIPNDYEDAMANQTDSFVQCIYKRILTVDTVVEAKKVLKTIWAKFDLQMLNLMDELAEPLLRMGDEKQKKIPENAEDCKLHFIRCIKPRPKPKDKNDRPGMFVHSMTLQQITYMGVMESVDLKQKNFPFRKRFEEFYAEYELLSPRYAQVRYYQMDKASENFQALSTAIVLESMQDLGKEYYAIGNTKVLMMPEARSIIDECKKRAAEKRDQMANRLKKAFCLLNGAQVGWKRAVRLQNIEKRYKKIYAEKQKVWAEIFRANFEKAIIQFKAEKRKAFEQRAARVMQDVIRKHKFRNQLSRAIRARARVVNDIYSTAYINKIRKYLISTIISTKIVSNAFNQARERIDGKSAWEIQRILRGYWARSKGDRLNWVKESIAQKENLRLHVSAKKIQKRLKGLIIRRKIDHFNKAAATIQSYFRMKVFREVFLMIKRNVMVLQRGVRRYMARRDMIKERMSNYLMQEFQVMNNVREMELFQLFGDDGNPALVKYHTPYSNKKISLLYRVADLHVIGDLSEQHSTPWASQWMQLYKDGIKDDNPILKLQVGTSHSVACNGRGKTYCWGWNDNGQCAKDPMYHDEVVIKNSSKVSEVKYNLPVNVFDQSGTVKCRQIIGTEDRTLVLLQDTCELVAWGGNEKGQLGLGHYTDVHTPTKLDFFSKQGLRVNSVAAGGNLTLATTENGLAFAWPFVKSGQKYSIPVQMPFHEKIVISRVSCGFNFGFFISIQGLVYAVGKDNSDGQLGLGHRYPNDIPEIVSCFKEAGERIDSIECGFRHSIARSTLGKVYTWGWNGHGQLGHGSFDSELSPRLLNLERAQIKREKAIQIAAGYSHTIIMTENNREILWFGTSGSLNKQSVPILFNPSEKLLSLFPENNSVNYAMGHMIDFAVVKIDCTWSKSMSLTNLTIVDLRAINKDQPYNKIASVLHQLSTKWDQREVMPPYIDVISGLFSTNIMRKPPAYVPLINNKPNLKTQTQNFQTPNRLSAQKGAPMSARR